MGRKWTEHFKAEHVHYVIVNGYMAKLLGGRR